MARSYRPVVRDQEFILPPNMADWLPEDHLVWFVLDVVDQLDTKAFHARRRLGGVGRQGFDPDMLLALLLYAYAVGERSSRRIERLCVDHVAFRVLCAQDAPDHTTIARFRSENEAAFADVFAQVLRLCAAAGMVKVGIVSIDGTKIAANASRGANRSPDKVRQEAQRIAEEVVAEAAAVDADEEAASDHDEPRGGLPDKYASRRGLAANIKKALAELDRQDGEHAQADAADRERAEAILAAMEAGEIGPSAVPANVDRVRYHRARIHRLRGVIEEVAGQSGADASKRRREARRVLKQAQASLAHAEEQVAAGNVDRRGKTARKREQREARARSRGGTGRTVNTTDPDSRLMTDGSSGGTVQGYNAQIAVTDDHLILGIHVSQDANDTGCFAPALHAATTAATELKSKIGTVLADAGYFTGENLTMPGPNRLIAPGKNCDVLHDAKTEPSSGPPPEGADPFEAMRHRLKNPENATIYKRRSATVETVNAHLKEQTGLRRFTRRGIQAVTAELNLAAAVINLRRLHAATPTT